MLWVFRIEIFSFVKLWKSLSWMRITIVLKTVEAPEGEYTLMCVHCTLYVTIYAQSMLDPQCTQLRMGNIINERIAVRNAVRYKRYNCAWNAEKGERERKKKTEKKSDIDLFFSAEACSSCCMHFILYGFYGDAHVAFILYLEHNILSSPS